MAPVRCDSSVDTCSLSTPSRRHVALLIRPCGSCFAVLLVVVMFMPRCLLQYMLSVIHLTLPKWYKHSLKLPKHSLMWEPTKRLISATLCITFFFALMLICLNRYGVDHPGYWEYKQEQSSFAEISRDGGSFPQDDGASQVQTASAFPHCKGTCQSGICTLTPRNAYHCFSEDKRDEEYASYGSRQWTPRSYKNYDGPKHWQAPRKDREYYQYRDEDSYHRWERK